MRLKVRGHSVVMEMLLNTSLTSVSILVLMCMFGPQEGANINKSLTTLGKVISALAEMVGPGSAGGSVHVS